MNDFFEKHKALIITLLFMGVFVLSLHNIALSNKSQAQKELLLELSALDYMEENLPNKTLEPTPEPEEISRTEKTHQAFNQESRVDQQAFEQRLADLNQKLTAGSESVSESADSENGTEAIAEKTSDDDTSNNAGKEEEEKENTITETANHDSSISYSLIKRKASKLPNPVYTCGNRGKIVINVVVNQHGHVTTAEVNTAASNSNNGCLHDSAIKYAKRAQFNTSERLQQLGTITYLFNY